MWYTGFSQDLFELSSLTDWHETLPLDLGRARMLPRIPKSPSGAATGAGHAAVLPLRPTRCLRMRLGAGSRLRLPLCRGLFDVTSITFYVKFQKDLGQGERNRNILVAVSNVRWCRGHGEI